MENMLSFLLGLALPPVVVWIMAKIAPQKLAKAFSKQLVKLLKDPKAADKIEDSIGQELIEIGQAIIDAHKIGDEPDVSRK